MNFFNSKAAIALFVAIGSSAISSEFVEDESNYRSKSHITSGWGWIGISPANATLSCDTADNGSTRCSSTQDPCDIYDCNPDTQSPPDTQNQGGNDGGGSTEPTWPEPPPTKEICIAQTEALVSQCKTVYGDFNASIGMFCGFVGFASAGGATMCATTVGLLSDKAGEWCDDAGKERNIKICGTIN